jgi:hypothetical protein
MLTGCATTTVQRTYGSPLWQREIETRCAQQYGITLDANGEYPHALVFTGAFAGAALLAAAFHDKPIIGGMIALLGAVALHETVREKRLREEDAISGYGQCVQDGILQYHFEQQKRFSGQ